MKILHIATDDKFLDHAIPVFEKVYPSANDVLVFAAGFPLKFVKLIPDYIEIRKGENFFERRKPKLPESFYQQYDLVIFHSLTVPAYLELINIPPKVPTVWLGFGFDYYNELLSSTSLHLKITQEIYNRLAPSKPEPSKPRALLNKLANALWPIKSKFWAVEKITVFSPVLSQEYQMVKRCRAWRHFPEFASWNYGTLEDNLIKGFEGGSITGDAILVGNSATYTSNHAEVFGLLQQLDVKGRQVVVPLSYGDSELAASLVVMGEKYFSNNFEPLLEFMPIEDYVRVIKKCGYVVMNHVRQQAVGNIVIMLYLGARVFLRRENPVYEFFMAHGVALSTVQELEARPELLKNPLTESERLSNRAMVSDYWSREKSYERTLKLVEKAVEIKA